MKNKVLVFMAVSIGLITAVLVYNYLSGLESFQQIEMVDVVVASRKIPANTIINASQLAWKQVSAESVHREAIGTMQSAQGRITNSEIIPGEQILTSRLFPEGELPGMAFSLPVDKRAVTIAVNEVIGVAGFIKSGDQVDVIATFSSDQPYTTTVLENVTVLAIAQEMEPQQNPTAVVSTSVTLALSPQQTEHLVLAESQGSLRLALRAPEASGIASHRGASMEDLQPFSYHQRQSQSSQEIAAPVPTPSASSSSRDITPSPPPIKAEIEVIKGTQREVQVIYE